MAARMARWTGWLALAALFATTEATRGDDCAPDRFEDSDYTVCSVDPSKLRLFWQDRQGVPYRSFANLAEAITGEGRTLSFAINAGMYGTDFSPVGLYIENGRELRPMDRTTLDRPIREVPNFYKKPNGVFFLGPKGAGILTSDEFAEAPPQARFATQSGPMLVIRGGLHPAFIPGSTDRTRRSGVGVCASGQVRFAISETGVNFHDFARLFRDHLACPNALFLDGGRGTGLYAPSLQRNDQSGHGGYGPILGAIDGTGSGDALPARRPSLDAAP